MTSKGLSAKRLGIYLIIVFAASMTLLLFSKPIGESMTVFFLMQQLFCWSPAIACIITRAVTKEGFLDMKLHLRLKGNLRYYLLALVLPLIYVPIMEILPIVLNGHTEQLVDFTWTDVAVAVMQLGSAATVGSVGLLGEELGWRGYMNQKLEPLLGTLGTCLAGGVIWGLWHFPNDILNYLNGYVSFPDALLNALERMVILIMLGIVLMWLTRKTDSVWPAVIMHFMHNSTIGVVGNIMLGDNHEVNIGEDITAKICEYAPPILLAVIFMVLMLRDNKKQNKSEA